MLTSAAAVRSLAASAEELLWDSRLFVPPAPARAGEQRGLASQLQGLAHPALALQAESSAGGAGTRSCRFANRLSVANGVKVPCAAVPVYGQVSLYNLPVLGLSTLDGL